MCLGNQIVSLEMSGEQLTRTSSKSLSVCIGEEYKSYTSDLSLLGLQQHTIRNGYVSIHSRSILFIFTLRVAEVKTFFAGH